MSFFKAQAKDVESELWQNTIDVYQQTKQKLKASFNIADVTSILSMQCKIDWSNRHEVEALKAEASLLNKT